MFGADSREYEIQLIDAVKSINRALGGSSSITSRSSRSGRSDFNQYEVQLIDAVKSIGRTLNGEISLGSGGGGYSDLYIGTTKAQKYAESQALKGITDFTASGKASIGGGIKLPNTKKIWFGDDSEEGAPYLELFRANPPAAGAEDTEDPIWSLHTNINLVIDGWASVGGSNPSGSGINLLQRIWESLTTNSDQYRDDMVHSGHIPIDTATLERNSNTIGLKSTLKTKIDNAIIGGADTGLTAPAKIRLCTEYPGTLAADTLYFLVEEASNNNNAS